VGTRQAATVSLPIAWLGMFRFVIPAIVLAPFWWRSGLWPKGVDKRLLAIIVAGAGGPFLVVAAFGMRFAPAAEVGVLLPGTMPLFVALTSAVVDGERFGSSRLFGFALALGAIFAIGGPPLLTGHGLGIFIVPIGALLWAFYTVAFRKSGLDPLTAAGLIAIWSTLMFLPFALLQGPAWVLALDWTVLGTQFLSQSILSGLVAVVTFGAAVNRLGASRAAIFSALSPALAALIAIPVLGEIPKPLTAFGIVLAVAGVALGSGAVRFGRK
jgi:drug/metabolite transporter (DMT)-like permease